MPKKKTKAKLSSRSQAKRKQKPKTKRKTKKNVAAKKKLVKKKPASKKKEELIGKVTHFYGKIKVAVVKLKSSLKVGDKIKIVGGETEFEQTVKSMEIDHKKIKKAPKGKEIGLKVSKKVREGYRVYKV